ncbi:MAG: hypothetical protein ACLFNI_11855 [Natronomonas sp.]
MDAHTVVEAWDARRFDDGYDELATLQSEGFTGAVEAESTWLFLRDGEALAVVADIDVDARPGDVEQFEGASGTMYEAPNGTAVSLAAMLALDGDVRGQYYTDDTPLSKVHGTLADGNFTGYVELSENVLSGDYYVVYEDGSASYIAFLGPSNRMLHDEDAEEKAKAEIGIYDVVAVEFPDVSIPEPQGATESNAEAADDSENDSSTEPEEHTGVEFEDDSEADAGQETETPSTVESDPDADSSDDDASARSESSESSIKETDDSSNEHVRQPPKRNKSGPTKAVAQSDDVRAQSTRSPERSSTQTTSTGIDGMTARRVPSLDPARSRTDTTERSSAGQSQLGPVTRPDPGHTDAPSDTSRTSAGEAVEPHSRPDPDETSGADVEEIRSEYESELDSIRSELEEIRDERDRLQDRIQHLESSGSNSGSAGSTTTGRTLSEVEAIGGTSLFVRETSRGDATLEDAHAGEGSRETVNENLRIEHHTEFDDVGASVDGEPFETFLHDSLYYQFAYWLVTELLFEIRSTGTQRKMGSLYDALPRIDRIGFREEVTDGEEYEGTFDVVARDRMGDPLAVATIDRSREPTRKDAMGPLVEDANEIAEAHDTLSAAFAVTASYFEPEALDVAREAASGSLLSRDKRLSYVKLSRKTGYHLCMVEAREGSFHLTVPEL